MNSPKEEDKDKLEDDDNLGFCFHKDQIKVTSLVATESSWVTLYENVLSLQDSDRLLKELYQDLPWNVETDQFGPQSRPTCYFADPHCTFSYVGLTLEPRDDWHPTVQALRQHATIAAADQLSNSTTESSSSPVTACLVNLYPQGEGFIPWHYDEIRAHGPGKIVASLSLGGPRRFQLRTRVSGSSSSSEAEAEETPKMVADLWLPSGSLLLMKGNVQEHYEHRLPLVVLETEEESNEGNKANGKNCHTTINPLRISLTFRSIVPGFEENLQEVASDLCCSTQHNEK